jgi:hypothetical protein
MGQSGAFGSLGKRGRFGRLLLLLLRYATALDERVIFKAGILVCHWITSGHRRTDE